MVFSLLSHRKSPIQIGVDVSSYQLRYAVLQQQDGQWCCLDGGIIRINSDVAGGWQTLYARCKRYTKSLNVGIALSDVLIKSYQLDAACSDGEICSYLWQQAEAIFGLTQTNLAMDYEVINQVAAEQLQIRMVATHKQLISQLMEYCRQAKLRIQIVGIGVLALSQLLPFIMPSCREPNVIVLIEKEYLIYCAQHNDQILFIKQIDYSFDQLQQDNRQAHYVSLALAQAQQFYISHSQQSPVQHLTLAGELAAALLVPLQELNNQLLITLAQINAEKLRLPTSELLQLQIPTLVTSIGLALWKNEQCMVKSK